MMTQIHTSGRVIQWGKDYVPSGSERELKKYLDAEISWTFPWVTGIIGRGSWECDNNTRPSPGRGGFTGTGQPFCLPVGRTRGSASLE